MYTILKLGFILWLGCISISPLFAQKSDSVDFYLNAAIDSFNDYNFKVAIQLAEKADSLAKLNQNSKGIVEANISKAGSLLELGEYKKVLECLEKAKTQPAFGNNAYFQTEFYRIRGRTMANLKIEKYALQDFRLQLEHSKKIPSEGLKNLSTFKAYQNILQSFEKSNQNDSVWKYSQKMESILSEIPESFKAYCSYSTYVLIANLHIEKSDFENAQLYATKAKEVGEQNQIKQKYEVFEISGVLAELDKNYKLAASHFEDAFLNAYELGLVEWARYYAFKLAEVYKQVDDSKSLKFLELGNILENSVSTYKKEATNILIEELITQNRDQEKETTHRTALIFAGILFVLLGWFVYQKRNFILQNNKKRKIIEENKKLIVKKEKVNEQLNKEISNLESDVKEIKFLELIEMAKNNHSEFLVLFQELYPNVIRKLKELNPEVKNSELIFCAYTFLNFSTKQIAEYTFVTVSAVQSRKNRYRKKYGIPSEVDFNVWMQNLNSPT